MKFFEPWTLIELSPIVVQKGDDLTPYWIIPEGRTEKILLDMCEVDKVFESVDEMVKYASKKPSISNILEERQKTHGDFETHAYICQMLKDVMHESTSWDALSNPQKESLEMIVHKIARILNGNADYKDHWTDIAGYATLIERILK